MGEASTGNRADQPLGLCSEHRTPRQNWGKFKAHKWGGFTSRLDRRHTQGLMPLVVALAVVEDAAAVVALVWA
jgi:hypothetical protein